MTTGLRRPDWCPMRPDPNKGPEWISVKNRLPEESGRYLVAAKLKGPVYPEVSTVDFARYGRKAGWYRTDDDLPFEVTHWMPLPELPKEETT